MLRDMMLRGLNCKKLRTYLNRKLEGDLSLELDVGIDDLYDNFKNAVNEITEKTVGLRKKKNVDGFDP